MSRAEPGYYAEVLRLRSDEATAHKYVLADSQLTPHIPEAEIARRRQARVRIMRRSRRSGFSPGSR